MQPTPAPRLHPGLTLGKVELSVADLKRSLGFYQNALGLHLLGTEGHTARLGAGARELLVLHEIPGATPAPRGAPGLYHFALLVPSRRDLARWLRHFAATGRRLGQSDHWVSEAFYLSDPDGHGIEVYRDRPRSEWRWELDQVRMGSDPIDIEGLLREAGPDEPWVGLPDGTVMGHVHLRVTDLEATETFYLGVLGFDVVSRWSGNALFVSVGSYHHHLGLNTWHSLNGQEAPRNSAKLERVWIELPSEQAVRDVAERLQLAGHPFTREDETLDVRDPSGNLLSFTT